jgi:alkanesulfonate monooxygenase SsuD/methylene tetrahydromethanopterin reductase-like flavin-dependent oxidoreductase (luciferase family)
MRMLGNVRRGASQAGRDLPADFLVSAIVTLAMLASHYSFLDPQEARFITSGLIRASCLTGTPEELVEQVRELERQGLTQIMLYPLLNRQYRVIEDFAGAVMARL